MAVIPAIVALFDALFQLSRDSIAHDRTVRLEEAKNRFTIGATSHMASVAFDKFGQFCEEYTNAVNGALGRADGSRCDPKQRFRRDLLMMGAIPMEKRSA